MIDGLPIAFKAEPLGAMFGVIASGLWVVNSIYSIGYMRALDEHAQTRYYFMFALAIFSAVSIALAEKMAEITPGCSPASSATRRARSRRASSMTPTGCARR